MRRGAGSFLPCNAVLELTYGCNHSCLFCSCPWFREDGGFEVLEELSTEEWKAVLDELGASGVSAFAFTGGEALLRGDCLELLEHAASLRVERTDTVGGELVTREVRPDIYLLSNGSPVDESVMGFLSTRGIRLSLSLPGLSTYERHTGHDSAEMVLELFRKARERGIPTTVNTTVTALNAHEIERTLSAAFLAGAGQLLLNRFLPGGRGLRNAAELSLTRERTVRMLADADDILTRAGRSGALGTEMPLCLLRDLELRTLRAGTRCSAALKFFVVGPSGYVRVCNHSEVRLEHVLDWRELKHSDYWNTFRMRNYLPTDCVDCGMKLDCDGGCREAAHITGGKVDSADPLLSRDGT